MTPTDDAWFELLHRDALGLLESWHHPDPAQQALRDDYLLFLDEHPDALARSCVIGHLTASALVLDESRTRVLLTLHPKVGRWLQLGGHHEPGDVSVREAARREAREESGIPAVEISSTPLRLDRHGVPCAGRASEHLDVQFLAWVPDDSVAIMSEESDDLRWFPLEDLPSGLDPSVLALIADAREGMSER